MSLQIATVGSLLFKLKLKLSKKMQITDLLVKELLAIFVLSILSDTN
jgi:hypothetical protein